MTKQQHTPGPWRLGARDEADNSLGVLAGREGPKTTAIGTVFPQPFYVADQQEANAAWIAAAPDLLAAAQEVAAHCADPWTGDTNRIREILLNTALAAISKAEDR